MSTLVLDKVNRVPRRSSYIHDIVGLLIPSKSGPEYPKIYVNYSDFYDDFCDDDLDLVKYRFIFDSGYNVAASKVVSEDNNYATLRLSNDEDIIYCSPTYGVNYKYKERSIPVSNRYDDYQNHFYVDYTNWVPELGDYISFTVENLDGHLAAALSYSHTTNLVLSPDDYAGGIYETGLGTWDKDSIIDFFNNSLTNCGYKTIRVSEYKYVYYKEKFFPTLNTTNILNVEVGNSVRYENNILAEYTELSKIIEFRSLIAGKNGSDLLIEIDTFNYRLNVYYKGVRRESFLYSSISNLVLNINNNSRYLLAEGFIENIELLKDGKYRLSNYIEETYDINSYLHSLDIINDDDYDVDIFLYDLYIDPGVDIINRIQDLVYDRNILCILNTDELYSYYPLIDIFITHGYWKYLNIEYPTGYMFLDYISKNYTGIINLDMVTIDNYNKILGQDNILPEYQGKIYGDVLESLGMNIIKYNNKNYYIDYYESITSPNNYSYKFIMNRVKKRFNILKNYLGSDFNTIVEVVKEQINVLSGSYLIESLTLSNIELGDGEMTIHLSLKLKQIINKVIKITLNIS